VEAKKKGLAAPENKGFGRQNKVKERMIRIQSCLEKRPKRKDRCAGRRK
jgi:hypothetical protein